MPLLTLKIDVDTYRGTREGVSNLVRLLKKHRANATFLFSLGPDHTGWALRRALRPGFFQKVSRTSVVEHYGLKTLMYGVLLPGPDIGKECAGEMRAVRDADFECGIHTWDHVAWQDNVRTQDAEWTRKIMLRSFERFHDVFGEAPRAHGAAGWQMNEHAFALLDEFGIPYASDGRAALSETGSLLDPGTSPCRLRLPRGDTRCIQMSTTLPTLDELLGRDVNGRTIDQSNIADVLLQLTAAPRDHVYTLHAELEGQKLAPIFKKLLDGWRSQGYEFGSMGDYFERVRSTAMPALAWYWGSVPGRSGELVMHEPHRSGNGSLR